MSWYSKVSWSEGLFLRQHHLQQADRYGEKLLEARTRHISPYPWGVSALEVDFDVAEQNKFGLRRVSGIFPDGTPFDFPGVAPLPKSIDVPAEAEKQYVWLTTPFATANGLEVDMKESTSGSRYVRELETLTDATSKMQLEEEIEVAHLRAELVIREKPKAGYNCIKLARIVEVRDKTIVLDTEFAPPVLVSHASPVVNGWLDRVIGWMDTKLQTLSRYAADASAGGGLQTFDYFMLQMLNREINVLRHMAGSQYLHPEQMYQKFLQLSGELATFTSSRLARSYAPYDHDDLQATFEPVVQDIQRFLSLDIGRAVRLDLIERAANAYIATVNDRTLFRNATFVVEVSAQMPLTQIQQQFPALTKVGPNTKMTEIVQTHLPGIELVHMPTPPRQVRAITNHVYFYLDKNTPLWSEFSSASGMGLHFAGDWPELELDLWAIMEEQR